MREYSQHKDMLDTLPINRALAGHLVCLWCYLAFFCGALGLLDIMPGDLTRAQWLGLSVIAAGAPLSIDVFFGSAKTPSGQNAHALYPGAHAASVKGQVRQFQWRAWVILGMLGQTLLLSSLWAPLSQPLGGSVSDLTLSCTWLIQTQLLGYALRSLLNLARWPTLILGFSAQGTLAWGGVLVMISLLSLYASGHLVVLGVASIAATFIFLAHLRIQAPLAAILSVQEKARRY